MSYLDESDEIAQGVTVRIAADGDGFKVYDHHAAWVRLDAEVTEDQSWPENVERFADEDKAWARFEERSGDGFAAMLFEACADVATPPA